MTKFDVIIKYCAIALAAAIIITIIVSAVKLVVMFTGSDNDGEMKEAQLDDTSNITKIDIDLAASQFEIRTGEDFSVSTDSKYINVSGDGDTLKIVEKKHTTFNTSTADTLILTIPADRVFEEVDIETGAGAVDIDALTCDSFSLDIGAGQVIISYLCVNVSAEIEGGAGQLTVKDGSVADLDFDMGVGSVELRCALVGSSKLNCGVGQVDIALLGEADDYTVNVSKGLGAVYVDGKSVSDSETVGDGANSVKISGGVGSINIDFEKE